MVTHTKRRSLPRKIKKVDIERRARPVRWGHASDGALDLVEGEEGGLDGGGGGVVRCHGGGGGGKAEEGKEGEDEGKHDCGCWCSGSNQRRKRCDVSTNVYKSKVEVVNH
jgi:hypothetical protein